MSIEDRRFEKREAVAREHELEKARAEADTLRAQLFAAVDACGNLRSRAEKAEAALTAAQAEVAVLRGAIEGIPVELTEPPRTDTKEKP